MSYRAPAVSINSDGGILRFIAKFWIKSRRWGIYGRPSTGTDMCASRSSTIRAIARRVMLNEVIFRSSVCCTKSE